MNKCLPALYKISRTLDSSGSPGFAKTQNHQHIKNPNSALRNPNSLTTFAPVKISASVYSNKSKPLEELVKELDSVGVDFFHIDCNDDPSVFPDIERIHAI